jgi:hypothetical protein
MNVNMWDVTDAIQRLIRERVGDADSRLRGHRRDVESRHLCQGHQRLRRLRRPAPRRRHLRSPRPAGALPRARARRRPPRRRSTAPHLQRDRRARRVRLLRVHSRPRRRHRSHHRPGGRPVGSARPANVMIKVPATAAGIPAIEELTAPRRQRQHHPAVLPRALRAGHRRLHRGPRATSDSRAAREHHRVGGVVLRLTRRRQGRRPAARRLRPPRPRRDRERPSRLRAATANTSPPHGEASALALAHKRRARRQREPLDDRTRQPSGMLAPAEVLGQPARGVRARQRDLAVAVEQHNRALGRRVVRERADEAPASPATHPRAPRGRCRARRDRARRTRVPCARARRPFSTTPQRAVTQAVYCSLSTATTRVGPRCSAR